MKNNKKGFTLAELLVVVGIIAVLIAIAIPVFSAQLEKSREAVDAANIRAKYAEIMTDAVSGSLPESMTGYDVNLTQEVDGWGTSDFNWPENLEVTGTPGEGGKATFTYANGIVTCTVNKAASGS